MYATPAFGRVWTVSVTSAPAGKQVGLSFASTGTSDDGVQGNATGLGPVFFAAGVPLVDDEPFPVDERDVVPVVEVAGDELDDGRFDGEGEP